MGQVNWPANERQWIDTSETHGWLAGGVNRDRSDREASKCSSNHIE